MLAIVGVVVAVVAAIALTEQKDTSDNAASAPSRTITRTASPSSSAPKPSSSAPSKAPSTDGSGSESGPKRFPLIVLNNSTVTGLAKQAAKQFEAAGWTVSNTDNLTNDILSTCAYYDPSQKGAKKAADKLQEQFPGIQRVEEKFPELPAGPVVVVLTGDYDAN